jgi:hypothetical protein
VGKTFLLDHAWPKTQRVFYLLAGDTTADQNRIEFLPELGRWAGAAFGPNGGEGDDIVSQLGAVRDRELRDRLLIPESALARDSATDYTSPRVQTSVARSLIGGTSAAMCIPAT